MIDWIKNINKDYPEFWRNYLTKFESRPQRYVALSIDYSGINPQKDVIMAFGAVGIENDKINIGDFLKLCYYNTFTYMKTDFQMRLLLKVPNQN